MKKQKEFYELVKNEQIVRDGLDIRYLSIYGFTIAAMMLVVLLFDLVMYIPVTTGIIVVFLILLKKQIFIFLTWLSRNRFATDIAKQYSKEINGLQSQLNKINDALLALDQSDISEIYSVDGISVSKTDVDTESKKLRSKKEELENKMDKVIKAQKLVLSYATVAKKETLQPY